MSSDGTKQIARKITSTVANLVTEMAEEEVDEVELLATCLYEIQKEVGRRLELDELYAVIRLSTKAIAACVDSGSPIAWAMAAMQNFDEG